MSSNESRRNKIIMAIMIITLIINFTDIKLINIISSLSILFSKPPADVIYSNDNPTFFSDDIYDISPEFIVIQEIILLRQDQITYQENLLFEIKFKNEGLKELKLPMFVIQILDPLNRVWAKEHIYSDTSNEIKIEYNLPSYNI